MKLKEQLRMLVILLAMPLAFVACDNNDDENGAPIVAEKGVFVFNSGNQASGIDGTLSFIAIICILLCPSQIQLK